MIIIAEILSQRLKDHQIVMLKLKVKCLSTILNSEYYKDFIEEN